MNNKTLPLFLAGLLMVISSIILAQFTSIQDMERGLIVGIGFGLMLIGLFLRHLKPNR